jgi:hypothetical protein
MRNYALQKGPCNFLDLRISPWEILFLLPLSLFSLSPWRPSSLSPPASHLSGHFLPASLPLLTLGWRGSEQALGSAAPGGRGRVRLGRCRAGAGGCGARARGRRGSEGERWRAGQPGVDPSAAQATACVGSSRRSARRQRGDWQAREPSGSWRAAHGGARGRRWRG